MEIVDAASANNLRELSQLVKRRSVVEQFGVQALVAASVAGHAQCVAKLIEADVDINQMNDDGMTALLFACQQGHLECVKLLIDAGGNDEMRKTTIKFFGAGALVSAARNGQVNCLSWLISIGICVNESDMDGMRPLVVACERNQPECVKLLIGAGADVNLKTCGRFFISHTTALISAAERGNLECVHLVLQAGADVNAKNGMNSTALLSAIFGSHVECVRYLVNKPNLDFDAIGSSDVPAIFEAIKIHHPECLEILLKHERLDVNVTDRNGMTVLMYAIMCSPMYAPQHLRLILELRNMDINASDVYGKTALVYAVEYGSLACVNIILSVEGVKVNVKFSDIRCQCSMATPLSAACNNGDSEIVLALLKAGAAFDSVQPTVRRSPLMLMARIGNIEYTKILLQAGMSAIQFDDQNKNSLYFAAKNGHIECLHILMKTLSDQDKTSFSVKNLFLSTSIKKSLFQKLPILLEAQIFNWDWYGEYFEPALRSLTKLFTLNSYVPEPFMLTENNAVKSTPLHYAFLRNDLGLIRYLMASLYLTPHDLHNFHKDQNLLHQVSTSGLEEVKTLHSNLFNAPWRLEVLSFLTVSNCLRRDKNRVDVINNSELKVLLPEKIQMRLAFQNPYQGWDIVDWDGIPVNNLQLDLKRLSLKDAAEPKDRTVELKFNHLKGVLMYHDYTFNDDSFDSSQDDEYSMHSENNSDNDDVDNGGDMEFADDGTDPLHISFDEDAGN